MPQGPGTYGSKKGRPKKKKKSGTDRKRYLQDKLGSEEYRQRLAMRRPR